MDARRFILGTDWWTDCDDVAAVKILAGAHREGAIRLIGVALNACMEASAPSMDAFLRSEGLVDIPIGVDFEATDFGGNPPYQKPLTAFPHEIRSNNACEDAVRLYRRLLSENNDVEIVEIGFPQVLANLLSSPPDEFSPLNGRALTAARVKHAWIMAGNWENDGRGTENNFARNARARTGAAALLEDWPGEITFLGWEVGSSVIVGGDTVRCEPESPFAVAFRAHGSSAGRSAWDPMLACLAIAGDAAAAGYSLVRGFARVDVLSGENNFTKDAHGRHAYVVKRMPDTWYTAKINTLL